MDEETLTWLKDSGVESSLIEELQNAYQEIPK